MTRPWRVLDTVATDEGALELRQRGDDEFLIVIAGRVLMTSAARRSEEALATLALAQIEHRSPRVLIGGLGMAFTLRAALDVLPATARVIVAELNPVVATWCRGPMASLTASAATDPRVTISIADVARTIAAAKASYDAILLDLYEGPNAASQRRDDPFYGATALARSKAALRPGGVLAVWSEDPDAGFAKRFAAAGFAVTTHRAGRGGRSHIVYLGRVEASAATPGVRRSSR